MKTILSLDISAATIGYSVFHYNEEEASLKKYNHLKLMTKQQAKGILPVRLISALDKVDKLLLDIKPDEVIIEDYAKKFSKGKSTIETIILLATFNELISMLIYQKLGKTAIKYPVSNIRNVVGKHFGVKIVSKDEIFPVIVEFCPSFKVKINKLGNTLKQSGDEADSIALGLTEILTKSKNIKKWNL